MLSDEKLLFLNCRGFIPGPSEFETDFIKRVQSVESSFENGGSIPRSHWDWVRLYLKEMFDFEPHCLPAFYSNRSLAPWQGAASWIENGKIASVQLREGLRKGSYWGNSREEILAHEAVHAARSAFNEPDSEEFFAYMTSEKWWRRAFGPIVRRPWEVWVFLMPAAASLIFPAANFIAACWVCAGAWRLMRLHRKLSKAGKALLAVSGDPKRARAVLVRLTDAEIGLFAKGEDILSFASRQKCLRWRLIRLAYLG